jgi:flagellar biosynthesis component FlhA
MITPPTDALNHINATIIDMANNPIQNIDKIRHSLVEAKIEIQNLRHHIESISKARPTSTEMSILQDKSAEMVKIWKYAIKNLSIKSAWVEGKDE